MSIIGTTFLALSLVEAGYSVFANTEASGTFNPLLAADANRRMEQAGVQLMGMFAIAMDLMRDWRSNPGLDQVLPFLDTYAVPCLFLKRLRNTDSSQLPLRVRSRCSCSCRFHF